MFIRYQVDYPSNYSIFSINRSNRKEREAMLVWFS